MSRHLTIALVIVLAALGSSPAEADGGFVSFVGCPEGKAIRGINFVTRSIVCVDVAGDTSALHARIAALEETLACMSRVGSELVIEGCNVHIRSGAGATDAAVNGLGNLIIGYNEDLVPPGIPAVVRTGSHNLVVGPLHTYSSSGGMVAGFANAVTGVNATVSGGQFNTASATRASVSGGNRNTASDIAASVSGGQLNTASAGGASVSGGSNNTASGISASVSGGGSNTANAGTASVSGGSSNTADGLAASVSGGIRNKASNNFASVSGGVENTASGGGATVSGGATRSATGEGDWVAGGLFQDD